MNRFTDLHMCDFTLTERDQQLQSIAEQYVRETEAYDRSVCTGPIRHGAILPVTAHQRALVIRNAQELMLSLCQRHPQFTRAEIRRAVHDLDRQGFRP
jgi:hypothetical protein